MKTKLIQHLDCEGEALGLYAYNADLKFHEAAKAIDIAFGCALAVLNEAEGEQGFGPGDVEGDADEVLSAQGIERVYTDFHYSEHF
jgi:hypothetical protein